MKNNESVPNLLLIGTDQMRWDSPGCNGNPVCRTPNIDRLAASGVNYRRAYAPASLCAPARASMWTGRHAFNHGMGTNCDMYHALSRELAEPNTLLHKRLLERGDRCAYFGKWHVGAETGPGDHGFEGLNLPGYGNVAADPGYHEYLRSIGHPDIAIDHALYLNPGEKTMAAGRRCGPVEATPAGYLCRQTIRQLETFAEGEAPFFLTCQFWGPHMPHLPSEEFYGLHDRASIEPWVNFDDDLTDKPARLRRERRDFYRQPPQGWDEWRELVGCYDDFCAMIDDRIGKILEALDRLGLRENTIVAFTSDHGDMTGSHGGLLDKGFIYEEAHKVPLIVSWPGVIQPGESDAPVYNMDLLPTYFAFRDLPLGDIDAAPLPDLGLDPAPARRDKLYLEFHGLRSLYTQRALVTDDGWKYVFTPGDFDEVYDLNEDPGELRNRIDDPALADRIRALRDRMVATAHELGDPVTDNMAKLFGEWKNRSGQPDATAQWASG